MSDRRQQIAASQRWVVKIGSALLTRGGKGIEHAVLADWVQQVAVLMRAGKQVVLVSSGAVAEGRVRLGLTERPKALEELQACAAVGQMGLVQAYESAFKSYGLHTAQILLTHEDLADRKRYLNARNTLLTLLRMGVVPVINENDTVATDEIRFGDNDTLAALVANLVEANLLVILTDQQGLYSANPSQDPQAHLIAEVAAEAPHLDAMVSSESTSGLGSGGMQTKLRAARLAARSGAWTWIASGHQSQVLDKIALADPLGSLLYTEQAPLAARKQWLAGHLQMKGELIVDAGAASALRCDHVSLLPVGVITCRGDFHRGDMVVCLNEAGQKIACGLVNYAAHEVQKILRQPSSAIEARLGYSDRPELIHYDNLVVF